MKNKIRVLHIIKTLNVGGAESNLFNLARCFDANRFEIHVAYSGQGEFEKRFQREGIKLFKFADNPHKLKSFYSLVIIWRLTQYIRLQKIDIVHTHTFNAHIWGVIAAKISGCKILEHVHDSRYMDPADFERRGERSKQYRFINFLKNTSNVVVVLTKQNYEFIIERRLYPAKRVKEIPNGINVADIMILSSAQKESLKRHFSIPFDAQVVVTPIRFSPEKNLKILFEIVKTLGQLMPQTVCLIAGDGPERANFDAMVKSAGAQSQIKVIGFYPNIPELLNIADVFLLPSTIELHSVAIMEAMRQRIPVVVSQDVGCNNEFIENWETGVLLDPFTDVGWADSLVRLLKDSRLRRTIGDNGYKTCIEKFDIQAVAKEFEALYCELVDRCAE